MSSRPQPPHPQIDYHEESHAERLRKKAEEAPFVPIGIAGMVGAIGWGIYSYKKRGNMSTSVFLMHLRVKAQSMVVGAMALGVGYSLCKDYVFNKDKKEDKNGQNGNNGKPTKGQNGG